MTNRYITERAEKSRWWDFPVIILCGMAALVALQLFARQLVAGAQPLPVLLDALIALIAMAPVALVLIRRDRQTSARNLAAFFANRTEAWLPLDRLESLTGTKGVGKKVETLVKAGYLREIVVDREKGVVHLNGRRAAAPATDGFCPACGARFPGTAAKDGHCPVCGCPVASK